MNLWPVVVLFALLLLNVPVPYSLLISAMFYLFAFDAGLSVAMVFQKMIAQEESFTLLAIPFFVTVGVIMTHSGIAKRMMNFAETITGHMNGGLAQVNIVVSALMGGCSGSANADAAMDSKMLVPIMVSKGYSKGFSAGITAASACITPIIPPGIGLILYASLANVSVADMFMAGYLPGILIMVLLMIATSFISRKKGYLPTREKKASFKEILVSFIDAFWTLVIPFGILMGLRLGWFTPTEAGAVAVVYCIIIGAFVYKELKIHMIPQILLESFTSTAVIMFIIAAAAAFGNYMSWERIPHNLTQMLLGITANKYLMLLIVTLFLTILGMFIEGTATLIIITPLLVPTMTALGVDPVHLGIIIVLIGVVGGITPPFGTLMFITCSAVRISIKEFVEESWELIVILLIAVLIIVYVPQLSLLIPGLLG